MAKVKGSDLGSDFSPAAARMGAPVQMDEKKSKPPEQPKGAKKPKCPQSTRHKHTRVYKWASPVRYCVCDDCGTNWKEIEETDDA